MFLPRLSTIFPSVPRNLLQLRTMSASASAVAKKLKDPSLLTDKAYIGGKWVSAASGATYPVINPANGQTIVTNPKMDGADTKAAIDAAYKAFPAWAAKTPKERQVVLEKWYDLMMAAQEDLAIILAEECGKPMAEAKGEIAYGASFIQCVMSSERKPETTGRGSLKLWPFAQMVRGRRQTHLWRRDSANDAWKEAGGY